MSLATSTAAPPSATTAAAVGMPRDQRDTLFVLAIMAVVLAPQLAHLPVWTAAMACALLAWRGWIAWRGAALPPRWITHLLLAAAVGGTWATFRTIIGAEAGVALIVLLLVLKTLEMRARRDAMVLFFLGFFTLLTLFFQSQSLPTALAMVLGLWGLLAALVNAHLPVGKPPLTLALRTAGQLLLWGTPFMVALFVLFPRMPPLWGLPTDSQRAKTGLSESMEVGNIAQLAQDPSVAMRLRFLTADGNPPPASRLYFRGPVLSHFDGRQWTAALAARPSPGDEPPQGIGPALHYEATLEPHSQRWLLTLDATLQPPVLARQRALPAGALQWQTQRPITEVLRYTAQVHLDYRTGRTLTAAEWRRHTQLPAQGNARTRAWATQLQARHQGQAPAILADVLLQLRQGGYRYTLEPEPVARDTADDFWFGQKAGFCEHMASAFALLMRAADIPARVVTGYQGGERNLVDGLWTVRQSDAHAWTEVWLPGDGWTRVDPTAAVAPSRVVETQRLRPPPTALGGAIDSVVGMDTLRRLRATWDAVNHRWNDWVLGYSSGQQSRLLDWLQRQGERPALWLGAASSALLALALWRLLRQRRHRPDPWRVLMEQARTRLRAQGIPTAPHMGTRALGAAANAQWGIGAAALQGWLERMERLRYAPPAPGMPSLGALRQEFNALPWPPARPPDRS